MRRRPATSSYRALASERRVLLLGALTEGGARTAEDLASVAGIHLNTARAHLQRLEDEGLIRSRREHRTTRGRPRRLFELCRGDDGDGPAEVAAERAASAIRLGEAYRSLYPSADEVPEEHRAQLDVLDAYLDRCGFQPRLEPSGLAFRLVCPFGDLFDRFERGLCAVHLELIRTTLAQVEGPVEPAGLEPFAEGGECVLRLVAMEPVPAS